MAIFPSFIFDASKGQTPESLARQRALAAQIMGQIGNRPARNVGEGIGNAFASIGHGIAANVLNRRATQAEDEGRKGANTLFDSIVSSITTGAPLSYGGSPAPVPGAPPAAPQASAPTDYPSQRVAQAHEASGVLPGSFMSAVDSSEGGGGYDTLFGFSNREGPFASVDVSQMTINDVMAFTDPRGPYAQFVKGKVGRVATPVGRHQIVGSTLRQAVRELGLDPNQPFDAATQDMVALHLAKKRVQSANTLPGKIAALRNEWEGFKNIPDEQMAQIVADIEATPIDAAGPFPRSGLQAQLEALPVGGSMVMPRPEQIATGPAQADSVMPFTPQSSTPEGAAPPPVQVADASGGMPPMPNAAPGDGLDLQTLIQAASNPWLNEGQRAVINSLLQQQLQTLDPSHQLDMDYRRAQIEKMRRDASGGNRRYGLNPIYGQDPETGETVLGVLGDDGTFKPVDTGGVQISTGVDRVDLGTHYGLLDKRSGQVVGTLPKENFQEAFDSAAGGAAGKAQGEAMVSLPTDLATAEQTITELDELIDHPGLSSIVGPFDQYRPSWAMGAEGRDALARFNQARGRAFLQAFGMLKGGGQITEIEGQKAEQAMARMDRAQSEAEFKRALEDFREAVRAGVDKLRQRAGQAPASGDGWQEIGGVRIRRKQ